MPPLPYITDLFSMLFQNAKIHTFPDMEKYFFCGGALRPVSPSGWEGIRKPVFKVSKSRCCVGYWVCPGGSTWHLGFDFLVGNLHALFLRHHNIFEVLVGDVAGVCKVPGEVQEQSVAQSKGRVLLLQPFK